MVDGVHGLDAAHARGELHVLGRLRVELVVKLLFDGINGATDLFTDLAEKTSSFTLRSSSHDNSTRSNLNFTAWNLRYHTCGNSWLSSLVNHTVNGEKVQLIVRNP